MDYEKLKLAHELILKVPEKYSMATHFGSGFETYYRLHASTVDWFEDYEDIDDLISKLKSLCSCGECGLDRPLTWTEILDDYVHGKDEIAVCQTCHSMYVKVIDCEHRSLEDTDMRKCFKCGALYS